MIPEFNNRGNLPPGIHFATWKEIISRFGGSARRIYLLQGLKLAILNLASAGCELIYIDGSFVTTKQEPGDFDACWSIKGVNANMLDPVFLDFSNGRSAQKTCFRGELFPAELPEGITGKVFLDFFQTDKETGKQKGIIALSIDHNEILESDITLTNNGIDEYDKK